MKRIFAVVSALVFAGNASAVLLNGTGGAQSDAAVAGGTTVGFDTLATGNFFSVTDGAVTVSGIGAPLTVATLFNGVYNTRGGQHIENGSDHVPDNFRIDFAGGTGAFTFNWGAADNDWLMSAFTGTDTLIESHIIALTNPSSNEGDYFGISTSNIAYVTLVDQKNNFSDGDWVFIDDVTFIADGGPAVPVPAPFALMVLGLAAIGFARRKAA